MEQPRNPQLPYRPSLPSGRVPGIAQAELAPAPHASRGPTVPCHWGRAEERTEAALAAGTSIFPFPRGGAASLASAGRMDLVTRSSDSRSCVTGVTTLLSPGNFPGPSPLLSTQVSRLDALKSSQPQHRPRGDRVVKLQGGLMGAAPARGHRSTSQA